MLESAKYTILTGWEILHAVSLEGGRLEAQGRGAAGHPRAIQRLRVFYPVCIVFISPPGAELCILPGYCAYFLRVVLFLCFSDKHTASQHVFPSHEMRNRRCAYSMFPKNTNMQNTCTKQTKLILLDY